jgi:hypothetical protein
MGRGDRVSLQGGNNKTFMLGIYCEILGRFASSCPAEGPPSSLPTGHCKPAKGNLQTCEGEPANLRRGTCKPAKEPPSFATSVGVLNGQTDPPRINRYKGQVEHCKVLQ